MTGRQKYAAAMTGTIQGPIYLHIALERLSLCDSGLWGWVAGILCSACWNKVDCWILFHNWIDFVHRSKSGSQLKSLTISKTVSTFDFWQTLSLHLIQILFATFYSFSTFWSGVGGGGGGKNVTVVHCVWTECENRARILKELNFGFQRLELVILSCSLFSAVSWPYIGSFTGKMTFSQNTKNPLLLLGPTR